MKTKNYLLAISLLASTLAMQSASVEAAFVLDDQPNCSGSGSGGNAINGITLSDVTGNAGGSSECWGTFNGNDPTNAGFEYDGTTYDFIAKENTPGSLEGFDIGLSLTPDDGSASFGTWSYDSALFDPSEFLIVLKAASKPGYAVWLFEGVDATSDSGNWNVAWTVGNGPNPSNPNLSQVFI